MPPTGGRGPHEAVQTGFDNRPESHLAPAIHPRQTFRDSLSETYGVVVRDLTGRQVVNTRQPWGTSLLLVTPSAPVVFRGKMQFDKAASSFLKAVKEAGERKIAFFRIASPGGSANDGIAISRWLRDHKNVRIIVSGACYSACSAAVLYAGADRITITAGGEIGLH
jgi:ClpP class serine protease